jgi:hypothetical protein
MRLHDWRKTATYTASIGDDAVIRDDALKGVPGYVYAHGLYIEVDGNGEYVLTIANTITKSDSRRLLEYKLYEWAEGEGYFN